MVTRLSVMTKFLGEIAQCNVEEFQIDWLVKWRHFKGITQYGGQIFGHCLWKVRCPLSKLPKTSWERFHFWCCVFVAKTVVGTIKFCTVGWWPLIAGNVSAPPNVMSPRVIGGHTHYFGLLRYFIFFMAAFCQKVARQIAGRFKTNINFDYAFMEWPNV